MTTKLCIIIAFLLLLASPIYLGKKISAGIASGPKRVAAWVVTIICLVVIVPFTLISVFVWVIPEYPVETKSIDGEYYFTQQEYGLAFTSPGYHVDLYKRRKYLWDKHVGHIDCQWWNQDIHARIIPGASGYSRLLLLEMGKVKIDTTLDLDRSFDFRYFDYKKETD